MKQLSILFILAFVCSRCLSQFPIHSILPTATATDGSVYSDTFLNTSSVLKAAGIKTIRIFNSSPEVSKSFTEITIQVNAQGMYEVTNSCIPSSNKTKGFCITDSLKYLPNGRISELKSLDGTGKMYMRCFVEYLNEGKSRWTYIANPSMTGAPPPDTVYLFHNNKSQLIRSEHVQGQFAFMNGSVYYNPDGLPDSIQHDVSGIKTYIFKRKKTKNKLTLLLDISSNQFKWEYNASGQCLLMQHTSANPKNWNRTTTYTRNLYYNPDGTLSKIVKENDGQIETIKYSYAK